MRTLITAAALAAFLAACSPPAPSVQEADTAAPPATAYAAVGESQGHWSLALRDGRIVYDMPTAAGWFATPAPAPRRVGEGVLYEMEGLSLAIMAGACADPALAPLYPDAVLFEVDGGAFTGCGGAVRAAEALRGTTWEVVRVDDTRSHDAPAAVLSFWTDGQIAGSLHCNDFGGGLRLEGDTFVPTTGAGEMTAVGCAKREDRAFDAALLAVLPNVRSHTLAGDTLTLRTEDGHEVELKRLL